MLQFVGGPRDGEVKLLDEGCRVVIREPWLPGRLHVYERTVDGESAILRYVGPLPIVDEGSLG